MPKFYDSKGNPHVLAEQIGRGGEGAVYFCAGNTELVAKIYYEPISDEKAEKLRLMAENKNERLLKVAAWVVETLHDEPNGKTVGFLMPNIKAKEIHELYSLKSRRIHFPEATWHYLVHTATNLARAFYSLHKYSHVIGDVNHGNCVVLADGTVKLIDCDSYAISDGEKRFRCEVGVATHLAPELQRANLRDIERTPEHDNFALAVVIFQLLFLGRHPFAGNYLGEKDKTLEDCISEYRFAYGKNAKNRKVKQPPGTLFLNEVSPQITELFERAFDADTTRPTPREWVEAWVDLSNNLAQCGLNPGHRFYNQLDTCPWCRIESQTGLMLFPFVVSEEQANGERTFNIFTVEKLIDNLGTQRNLPAKLSKPPTLAKPEPSREIIENVRIQRNYQFLYIGGYFITFIGLILILGTVLGTIISIFLMLFLFTFVSKQNRELKEDLLDNLKIAEGKWEKIEKQWNLSNSPQMLAGDIKVLKQKITDYKNFQVKTRKDLILIEKEHKDRQFENYLRSFRLAQNEIEGISSKERSDLVEKRIFTAAEINKEKLINNYHLDKSLIENLVTWRKDLEGNFVFHKNDKSLKKRKTSLLEANSSKSREIEKDIEQSLELVRKNSVQASQNQKLLIPKSEEIAKESLQYQSDLDAVGDTSFALVSFILITFLVPFFGGILSVASGVDSHIQTDDSYVVEQPIRDEENFKIGVHFAEENLTKEQAESLEVVDKNITDESILELSDSTRLILSDNLIRQAIAYIKLSKEESQKVKKEYFTKANENFDLAWRVLPRNLYAFEQFGVTLYNIKEYKRAIDYFSKFEKLNLKSNLAELHIGMSYLELKQYENARKTLLELVKQDASTSAYYNLGLAYKGLKDYEKAEKSFKYAIEMDSSNLEAQYELGYTYFKLNDKEAFNKQYSKLLQLDSEKAAELLEKSYKLPPTLTEKDEGFETGEGKGTGSGSDSSN